MSASRTASAFLSDTAMVRCRLWMKQSEKGMPALRTPLMTFMSPSWTARKMDLSTASRYCCTPSAVMCVASTFLQDRTVS